MRVANCPISIFFDADAAWRLVHELSSDAPALKAVAIVKTRQRFGCALGTSLIEAFAHALAGRSPECLWRRGCGRRRR